MIKNKAITMKTPYIIILLFTTCISGCAVFYPGHENSAATKNEKTNLEFHQYTYPKKVYQNFSDLKDMCPKPKTDDVQAKFAPIVGAAAAAITGFAVDQIKSSLEKEAKLHDANWVTSNFPIRTNPANENDIIEFENISLGTEASESSNRDVEFIQITASRKTEENEASKIVLNLYRCDTNLLAVPMSYDLKLSKAKVFYWRWWSFIPVFWYHWPMYWYQSIFEEPGDLITNIAVTIDGESQSVQLPQKNLANKTSAKLNRNILVYTDALEEAKETKKIKDKKIIHSFNISVRESDPSEVKDFYNDTAGLVNSLKKPITDGISDALKDKGK